MKKILCIGTTNIYGGVGHIMLELCRNVDREKVSFDFLYYQDATDKEKDMIYALGGEFYKVPRYSKEPIAFYKAMKKFYKEHQYDVVHIHASSAMLMMYAFPVWKSKDTNIVYQSHVDKIEGKANKILHNFFRKYVNQYAKCKLAVSGIAAEFMYGANSTRDVFILKNGIALDSFKFDQVIREKIRKELKIDSNYVVGHVGRFSTQKNHSFLIDVFAEINRKNPDAVLLLVGKGEDENQIRKQVKEYQLMEYVIFYGTSNYVHELFCAMDCFLFPSLWEGLGIVAIEAQASGLPVVASDKVPIEANITNLFHYKKLADPITEWSDCVMQFRNDVIDRERYVDEVRKSGYDIQSVAKQLEEIYISL